MAWIKTIDYDNADPKLKKIYDKVKGPDNNVDNVLSIHSLRPHTLVGHMALYKNVLHNSNNKLPKWYLETLGVYTSFLNQCNYCVQHHFTGLQRLLKDDEKAAKILAAVKSDSLQEVLDEKYYGGSVYAKLLTLNHSWIDKSTIDELRNLDFSDGEILEVNQVTSYFNYVNRMVVGLGVDLAGDILGLSPNDSDDPDNWSHS